MTTSEHAASRDIRRKPTDAEIDVHGLTHIGKVRTENQDHFLIGSLHKQIRVRETSLSEADLNSTRSGGTPYGATHVSGTANDRPVNDEESRLAFALGKRLAGLAARLSQSPSPRP